MSVVRSSDIVGSHPGSGVPVSMVSGFSSSVFVNGQPCVLSGGVTSPHVYVDGSGEAPHPGTAVGFGSVFADGGIVVGVGDLTSCGLTFENGSHDVVLN